MKFIKIFINRIYVKSINILRFLFTLNITDQIPSVSNKLFSIGSYGRAGVAYGLGTSNGDFPQSLNLNGMGSIGGRFEANDYFELATVLHLDHLLQTRKKLK